MGDGGLEFFLHGVKFLDAILEGDCVHFVGVQGKIW